jgi:predicted Zn-dependent peptidase
MSTITTVHLPCGTPLLMESMSGVRSVGLTWLVPAGFATDPEDRRGLATMLSEMMARGSGDLDSRAFADRMDTLGASYDIDAGPRHMRISSTLVGARLREALPTIADIVLRPRLEEDAVEPTRDLALQALEGLKDDPQERAMLALRERHIAPPLNRSDYGTVEGLTAITRDDLVAGWARQGRPGGAIIAIAGDLDAAGGPGAIADALAGLLSGWSGAAPEIAPGRPTDRGTDHHIPDSSSQVQIALMHDAPAEKHPDSRLERVVSAVLSGGMASRLFTEVREKRGLCYAVSQSYAAERDAGRCTAYVGTQPERAQESLTVLIEQLHHIQTPAGRITEEEFHRAIIGIRSSLVLAGESTSARAGALAGDQFRIGRPRSLTELDASYASITLDEVNAYLARRSIGEMTVVSLGPAMVRRGA